MYSIKFAVSEKVSQHIKNIQTNLIRQYVWEESK